MADTGARRCASSNVDLTTVEGFGREWARFDQTALSESETSELFEDYFRLFPWESLPAAAAGFDAGCGSGRWARLVAPRVGRLHLIDASAEALLVARRNLAAAGNCEFHHASLEQMPLRDGSMDFGYSLGVLHHLPDPASGLAACARKLKPGAPLLVYIYYSLDHRPGWYRRLWRASDRLRRALAEAPPPVRHGASQLLAAAVYYPLARAAWLAERAGAEVSGWPLSGYRRRSFYTMRTDALDRFGTRVERRFTASDIEQMMRAAGLEDVRFSPASPFWCAIGYRESADGHRCPRGAERQPVADGTELSNRFLRSAQGRLGRLVAERLPVTEGTELSNHFLRSL